MASLAWFPANMKYIKCSIQELSELQREYIQLYVQNIKMFRAPWPIQNQGWKVCILLARSSVYLLPLILSALLHVDLINIAYFTECAFIRSS